MKKLSAVIDAIQAIDTAVHKKTQARLDNLTKPQGSLGKLEDLAKQVVAITGKDVPSLTNKVVFTLAGDHGVVAEGVSAFPQEVTPQMVYNFIRGGAGINVLARHAGARVVIADLGVACDLDTDPALIVKKVNYGTRNIAAGPAMSREEAIASLENGIALFEEEYEKGIDIIGTGDMGIGNTTPSSALTAVITGAAVGVVTGRGTGIADDALAHKQQVIEKSIALNNPDKNDPIDVLAKVGGFEIGGLAGVMLAAAAKRVPIIIDGFISGAAALIAYELKPEIKDYLIAAHSSVEQGHALVLQHLGCEPLLNFNLRLGEGTGAALAFPIVEASIKILTEMATFASAEVSEKVE